MTRNIEFKFNHHNLTIDCFLDGHFNGDIDLEAINSCAELLDWIFHMRHKTDAKNFYELCELFFRVFDPQANCCSGGVEKEFNGAMLAKRFIRAHPYLDIQ